MRWLLAKFGFRDRGSSTTRVRTADQARREAALLRDAAKHAMGALSVETHDQRLAKKTRLEAAVERLESEADQLDEKSGRPPQGR